MTTERPPSPTRQPKARRNDPARAGKRASKAVLWGGSSRYATYAVHTRFEAIQWFTQDAEQTDPVTGLPKVVRQADTFEAACQGLPLGQRDYFDE